MRFVIALLLLFSFRAAACERVGFLTQPTTPGTTTVVFGGAQTCQPKVVLFFYSNNTGNGVIADATFGFGAMTNDGQMSSFSRATHGADPTNIDRRGSTTKAIMVIDASRAIIASAALGTLDVDGFNVVWDVADSTARIVNYYALGGPDITQAAIGNYVGAGATQNITVGSGAGWQPDLVLLHSVGNTTGQAGWTQTIGLYHSSFTWSISTAAADNLGTTDTFRRQRSSTKVFSALNPAGVLQTDCETVTPISTGFTVACSTQGTIETSYIAIKGGQYKAGIFTGATTSGNAASITGVGFTQTSVLIASYTAVANTSTQSLSRSTCGAGTSSTSRFVLWHGSSDAAVTDISSTCLDRANIIQVKSENGGAVGNLASADLVSFSSASS